MATTQKRPARTTKVSKEKLTDEYGHLQPQAPELEKAVLGALMIEKDAYSLVSEILKPESFYEHRRLKRMHIRLLVKFLNRNLSTSTDIS